MKTAALVAAATLCLAQAAPAAPPAPPAEPAHTATYAVYIMGGRVGDASFSVWREGDIYRSESRSGFSLSRSGAVQNFSFKAETEVGADDYLPRKYALEADLAGAKAYVSGLRKGAQTFVVSVSGVLGSAKREVPLGPDVVILDNNYLFGHYWYLLKKLDLSSREVQRVKMIVPQAMASVEGAFGLSCTVVGHEALELPSGTRTAIKIRCLADTGLEMFLWAEEDGPRLLKLDVPGQRSYAVIEEEEGAGEKGAGEEGAPEEGAAPVSVEAMTADLVSDLFIAPGFADHTTLAAMRVELRCGIKVIDEESEGGRGIWTEPATHARGQSFRGELKEGRAPMLRTVEGVFTIERSVYAGEDSAPYPIRGAPEDVQGFLLPSWRVESDHEEMRAAAVELAEGARTAWDVASAAARHVSRNTRYALTGGSALDCLRSGEGDCGPQALLLVGLCRAAGVPARLAGGLLFADGRFGQHNWAEAYCGDKAGWIPIDPTTHEVGTFSASHVTLWHGAGALDPSADNSAVMLALDYTPNP